MDLFSDLMTAIHKKLKANFKIVNRKAINLLKRGNMF